MKDQKKSRNDSTSGAAGLKKEIGPATAGSGGNQSPALLNALIGNMRTGILVENPDRRIIVINRALCEMFDIPSDLQEHLGCDSLGLTDRMKCFVKYPDQFVDRITQLVREETNSPGEEIPLTSGGTCERDYLRILADDGALIAHLWQYRNISGRKRAENVQKAIYHISEAASTSEDLDELYVKIHQIVGELMPVNNFYIALFDKVSSTLSFPYFVDEYDTTPPSKPLGKGLTEYVLREGEPLLASPGVFESLVTQGEVEPIGAPSIDWLGVPLKRGEEPIGVLVVQSYTEGVRFSEEQKSILMFVSTQVAMAIERKRTVEMMRDSEERYRAFVERSSEGIWRYEVEEPIPIDLPGELLVERFYELAYLAECNDAMARMYGHSGASDLVGTRLGDLLIRSDPQNIAFLSAFIRSGFRLTDAESHEIDKNGNSKYFLNNLVGIIEDGCLVRAWGTQLDITATKNLEEQLRQAQKLESIGTLAGGISHDFNNLLGIILGYATQIPEIHNEPERLTQHIEAIQRAVKRGAHLVRQLLMFARKTDVLLAPVNINDIVLDLVGMMQETFPKTVTFEMKLDDRVPSFNADHNQIHQALFNLSLNAREAMDDGGSIVFTTSVMNAGEVQAKFHDAPAEQYVRVSVTDSGRGMDSQFRSHIFEPFFTTKESKSAGLGLAVVYGIVKSHQGFIDLDSEKDRGTTFSLYFPVAQQRVSASQPRAAQEAETAGGGETILLVEDEEMLLDLLRHILEGKGYNVLAAGDGIEAVEIYKRYSDTIALVLSDMGLPRLGGWEAFQQMKQINPGVKAILASGYLDPGLRSRMFAEGAREFVQKPYDPTEIIRTIREIIDSR